MKYVINHPNYKENYIKNLLAVRGIDNFENFVNPSTAALQPWKDLDNIYRGVTEIQRLSKESKVGLIVDCDCDGYTSSAIMYQYLHNIINDINIDIYIHSGKAHGLEEHWQKIKEANYDLVIVPDAGSNDEVYAKEISCPILIIDHHLVDQMDFSDNMIVINNQLSNNYKNKSLSGAGMVYQFCKALDYFYNVNYADNYLDLAALGIDGDMMSGLEIENQWFWKIGFSHIKNFFFQTLCDKQSFSMGGKVNPVSVAFYIVPMINAMIRVGTLDEKTRLFRAFVDGHALVESNKRGAKGTLEQVAIESARECTNCRTKQNKILDTAMASVESKIFKNDLLENEILLVRLNAEDTFPSELNGLLAMKLSAKYKKPTIVARLNNEGYVRGSGRGLNQSELESFKDFLLESGYFEYAQGHDNAFGCSIANADLFNFHSYANEKLKDIDFGQNAYEVDFVRSGNDYDINNIIKELAAYEDIWSQNNNQPKIAITDITVSKDKMQIMGKSKNTVKFVYNGVTYLKFFADDLIKEIEEKGHLGLTIVGKTNLNEWNGSITPQIFIDDYNIISEKETISNLISF